MLACNDIQPNMGSGDQPSPRLKESDASTFKKVADTINEQFDDSFATPAMIEIFQEQYDELDSGGTGVITKEDLANLYKHRTQDCGACGDEIIDAIYTEMDYDEDGEVTFLDFAIFMTLQMKRRAEMDEVDFTRAFDMADKDGDGFVTKEDLLMSLGGTTIMDSEDADRIICQYDRDGKGTLNCEEYCEFMHDQGKRSLDYFCKPDYCSQTMSSCVSLDSIFDAISVASYETVNTTPHEKGDVSFQKGMDKLSLESIFDAISVASYETVKSALREKGDVSFQKETDKKLSLHSIFDAISVTSSGTVKTTPHEKGEATFQKGPDEQSKCGEEKRLTTPVPRPDGAELRIGELITDPDFEKACRENFDTLDSDKDGVLTSSETVKTPHEKGEGFQKETKRKSKCLIV